MTDVKEILQEDSETVRNFLEGFKDKTKPNLGPFTDIADELHSLTWEYTGREWKGLRSSFVLRTAAAFNGDMELASALAPVMQTEQDWILIEDDFEDKSPLRRGKPALWKMQGVGEDIAVNVGARMRTITDRIFGNAIQNIHEDRKWQLYYFRNEMLDQTTQGQHFEMTMRRLPLPKISLAAVLLIYDRKTGGYTYELPCGYGMHASYLSAAEILKGRLGFRDYGAPFQIRDDYLNLKAKADSDYGKEFADDILEGKWTIFAALAEEMLKGKDLKRHHEIYGNRNATIEDRREEIEMFEKYGVLNQSMAIQRALWDQARNKVCDFVPHTPEGEILIRVLDYGCDRSK